MSWLALLFHMWEISTDEAPSSIGPYSQAIRDGDRIYVSGQGPIDPATGGIVEGNIKEQTDQTLDNIDSILRAGGASLDGVVKATVFLTDMGTYDSINGVYLERFTDPYPARSAVEVSDLPVDIGVEIEVIASAT